MTKTEILNEFSREIENLKNVNGEEAIIVSHRRIANWIKSFLGDQHYVEWVELKNESSEKLIKHAESILLVFCQKLSK